MDYEKIAEAAETTVICINNDKLGGKNLDVINFISGFDLTEKEKIAVAMFIGSTQGGNFEIEFDEF